MDPLLLGTSAVNCICGSMELMQCACWMTKVSSTYLSQSLGGLVVVLMTLDSDSYINRFATMWLIGQPMADPWTYP